MLLIILAVFLFAGCEDYEIQEYNGELYYSTKFKPGADMWKDQCLRTVGAEAISNFTLSCIEALSVEEQAYVVKECRRTAFDVLCTKKVMLE